MNAALQWWAPAELNRGDYCWNARVEKVKRIDFALGTCHQLSHSFLSLNSEMTCRSS